MGKVLVVQPFIGEFGWEVFAWQPLIRSIWLSGGFDRCIVYSTREGCSWLYRFAEVRKFPHDIPKHEAECMVWHGIQDYMQDLGHIIEQTAELAKVEFGKDAALFTLQQVERPNYPYWERGQPDLLHPDGISAMTGKPVAVCIRDREMSNYRNSPPGIWTAAVSLMVQAGITPIIVGNTRPDGPWADIPEGFGNDTIIDLRGKTSVNDMIGLFWNVGRTGGLVVGGLTGLVHLASRCACPHLVYGNDKCVERCAAANWFGARHKVLTEWGWEPDPVAVAQLCTDWFASKEVLQ